MTACQAVMGAAAGLLVCLVILFAILKSREEREGEAPPDCGYIKIEGAADIDHINGYVMRRYVDDDGNEVIEVSENE